MGYSFDGATKKISLTSTSFDAQDLYSRWKDWALTNSWASFAIEAVGGDDLGGGTRAGDYYFLQTGWKIVPLDSDHVLTVTGNIYPQVAGANMFDSRAGRNVQIQLSRSQLTQTIAVGSGVLPTDVTAIAAATRDQILTDGHAFPGAYIDASISSAGGSLTPDQAAALVELQLRMAEVWRLMGLDIDAPLVVAQTQRTAGTIEQTITEDSGDVTVTRTA